MNERGLARLNLFMQCEIMKALNIRDEINPDFVQSAILGGHMWALDWEYSGLLGEEIDRAIVDEVCNYLDMRAFLERGYENLSKQDKEKVAEQAHPFGADVRFSGFDGNNESRHLSVANFLIREMERFQHFASREMNSHMHTLSVYSRMYEAFEPMRPKLADRHLNVQEIITILNSQRAAD